MSIQPEKFISQDCLFPVFQPIVSLSTGSIYGYEALTRINDPSTAAKNFNIEQLFIYAETHGQLWKLEKICRKRALKMAKLQGLKHHLFLNVNPAVIHDSAFRDGFTLEKLKKYNIDPSHIIFEITERTSISDMDSFNKSIQHYENQGFKIALDDVGSCYSGLQLICSLNPACIKIDIRFVSGIGRDKMKQSLVKSLADFSKSSGIMLVAEGIETAEEFVTLMRLGVGYGQGYFIARPAQFFGKVSAEAFALISAYNASIRRKQQDDAQVAETNKINKHLFSKKAAKTKIDSKTKLVMQAKDDTEILQTKGIVQRTVQSLCTSGITVPLYASAQDIIKVFHDEPLCPSITVVNDDFEIRGILPRAMLVNCFGGQFGYSLNSRKTAADIMESDILVLDSDEPIESAAVKAMSRGEDHLYTPVPVQHDGRFAGILTIKDLLDSIIAVEVNERTLEINRKNRLLIEQQKIAGRDLQMAEHVQKNFYPSCAPSTQHWDCAFVFNPMSSVTGDVYDFYYDVEGALTGAALFDVSGHGIASALVGILAKSLSQKTFTSNESSPLDVVMSKLNESLVRDKGAVENYLTGILLRINGGKLEYTNAAHTEVLVKNGGTVSVLGEGQDCRGTFVGIPDFPTSFAAVQTELKAGDVLLLYTDCLTESRNLAGDELGTERLTKIFHKAPEGAAQEILDYVLDVFACFTEAVPIRDDLTAIVMRYKG